MKINELAKPLKNPLCVALDVDTKERALELFHELKDVAGGFKLGPRLILKYGADLISTIAKESPVFVDCKFFDIPTTMISSVKASFEAGASLVTVHAMAGKEPLRELAKLEKELNSQRPFRILAVTILTSWDEGSFPQNFKSQQVDEHVLQLSDLASQAGIQSLVCSPHELHHFTDQSKYLVTPGIRFDMESKGDQKRTMQPHDAIHAGASVLVVGRPIIEAKKPLETATDYLAAIYEKR